MKAARKEKPIVPPEADLNEPFLTRGQARTLEACCTKAQNRALQLEHKVAELSAARDAAINGAGAIMSRADALDEARKQLLARVADLEAWMAAATPWLPPLAVSSMPTIREVVHPFAQPFSSSTVASVQQSRRKSQRRSR